MTLILNIYEFVAQDPFFFLAEVQFFFFLVQKGLQPYTNDHDIPLVTLILNIGMGFLV